MFNFILKWFRKPEEIIQPEPEIIDFFEEPFFDNSTEHFLDIIRVFVVITVQQFIFILISKFILNKIWKKRERTSLILSVFCIWGMSSSLSLIFWFPLSVFFQYYFVQQWIISYFSCLWRWMFYNSMATLYGLMPAAYLISETATMVGTLNKFKEVTMVLTLVYILIVGLVYIFQSYFNLHINTIRQYFSIVNAIPTIICSWVCVIAIPCGITSLFKKIKSIPVSINHNQEIENQMNEIGFEIDRLTVQLQQKNIQEEKLIEEQNDLDMKLTDPRNIERRKECIRELKHIKEEKNSLDKNMKDLIQNQIKLKKQLGSSPFFRLIIFMITFVASTFIYLGLFARISWHAIEGLDDYIGASEWISNSVKSILNLVGLTDARMVKFHIVNLLGAIQTKKVFAFLIYLFLAYWFLIFLLSRVSERTAISRILGNIFPILIFACVIPVISKTFGIHSRSFTMLMFTQLVYTCLIVFLMAVILLGFYEYLCPKLLPKKGKTTTMVILANVMLLIIISYTTLFFIKAINIIDIDPKILQHFLEFSTQTTKAVQLYYTLYKFIVSIFFIYPIMTILLV